jgi:hypothetical protein
MTLNYDTKISPSKSSLKGANPENKGDFSRRVFLPYKSKSFNSIRIMACIL